MANGEVFVISRLAIGLKNGHERNEELSSSACCRMFFMFVEMYVLLLCLFLKVIFSKNYI